MIREGTFPMSAWSYTSFDQVGPESIKDWTDAGLTVVQTPRFVPGQTEVKTMLAFLDACGEAGLRAILNDNRATFYGRTDEDAFRRDFAAALKDFGSHPAVFGFHVGDEPNKDCAHIAFRTSAIHREMAPELSPFLNLGPYGPGTAEWVGYDDYDHFMEDYITIGNPEFLCFDVYWQMLPEDEGRELYFGCLKKFSDAARQYDRPMWITPLAVGHFRYRCPNEDHFRWQINTAVAHGAAGIAWFFLYMREPHSNYRVPPIDEHWERTETYAWLSRVSRTFLKTHAPIVQNLTLQNVYHYGRVWGGFPELGGRSRFLKRIEGKLPVILSEFKDPDGRDYVAVVNNSQEDSDQAVLRWRGSPTILSVGCHGAEAGPPTARRDDEGRDSETGDLITGPWLAPGQMELYRVE